MKYNISISYYFRIFKANMKLTSFYNLLVKEITSSEGVASIDPDKKGIPNFAENRKDVLELSQKFLPKKNFFCSYIIRTIMEVILAAVLLAFLAVQGIPTVLEVITSTLNSLYLENKFINYIWKIIEGESLVI